jgi:hypothetical protein
LPLTVYNQSFPNAGAVYHSPVTDVLWAGTPLPESMKQTVELLLAAKTNTRFRLIVMARMNFFLFVIFILRILILSDQ